MTLFARYLATMAFSAALIGTGASTVFAAQEIGAVKRVFNYAYGTLPEEDKEAIFRHNKVFANHLVETVKKGGLHITFQDGTDLRLGANSSMVIDDFVYDPNNPNQAGVFNMTAGIFRFISGNMEKENYKILTPHAEIGIRGTDIQVTIGDGETELAVFHGQATLKSNKGGDQPVTVNAGQKASTGGGSGTAITGVAPAKFSDPGLTDKAARDAGRSGGDGAGGGNGGGGVN